MAMLSIYLRDKNLTQVEFAELASTTQATISRVCRGHIPSRPIMQQIFVATEGAVTPNDIYQIEAAA